MGKLIFCHAFWLSNSVGWEALFKAIANGLCRLRPVKEILSHSSLRVRFTTRTSAPTNPGLRPTTWSCLETQDMSLNPSHGILDRDPSMTRDLRYDSDSKIQDLSSELDLRLESRLWPKTWDPTLVRHTRPHPDIILDPILDFEPKLETQAPTITRNLRFDPNLVIKVWP